MGGPFSNLPSGEQTNSRCALVTQGRRLYCPGRDTFEGGPATSRSQRHAPRSVLKGFGRRGSLLVFLPGLLLVGLREVVGGVGVEFLEHGSRQVVLAVGIEDDGGAAGG